MHPNSRFRVVWDLLALLIVLTDSVKLPSARAAASMRDLKVLEGHLATFVTT